MCLPFDWFRMHVISPISKQTKPETVRRTVHGSRVARLVNNATDMYDI